MRVQTMARPKPNNGRGRAPLNLRRQTFLVGALLAVTVAGWAQFGSGGGVRLATPDSFDGAFNWCRTFYRRNPYGDGGGWSTDYPRADQNFSFRLAELTKTIISRDSRGDINHLVVTLNQLELSRCPWIMMAEVGSLYLDETEAAALRNYLLKGGFLWVDDFWGTHAWQQWSGEMQKVLPEFPIVDVPDDHPLRHTLFQVSHVPQVTSINFWRTSGGTTSERGSDSPQANLRMIADDKGRIMVLMTHNTDIGDSWEREGEDHEFFLQFSPDGYALGIDVVLYALTPHRESRLVICSPRRGSLAERGRYAGRPLRPESRATRRHA